MVREIVRAATPTSNCASAAAATFTAELAEVLAAKQHGEPFGGAFQPVNDMDALADVAGVALGG
jgi:hypothetical protein